MTAYLIVYGKDPSDRFAVYTFPTRTAALAANLTPTVPVDGYGRPKDGGEERPGVGGCSYVVEREEDAPWALPMLAAIYNAATGETVKRFADRPTGVKRLLAALPRVAQEPPVAVVPPSFTSPTPEVIPASSATPTPEGKMENSETTTKQRGRRPEVNYPTDAIIHVLKDNPAREGSKRAARFGHFKEGITVQQFLDDGGLARDIKKCVANGFISVG